VTVLAEDERLEIRESLDSLDAAGLEEAVARRVEKTAAAGNPVRPDGLVPLYIIRPGIGRGRGKHLYEADMLEREVSEGRFKGWKMYVDHQAPEAKKASGGLPRSIRDLGGFIKEAWWDPAVAPDPERGWGKGAVIGLAKPTRLMRDLIEDIPEAIGASISASATSVRPVQRGGDTVWLVEGIKPKGSVDFVTEAGAGGRVVSIMEALDEHELALEEGELLLEDGVGDDKFADWLLENRPDVIERVLEEAGAADGDDGELEKLTKQLLPKFKGNRKLAQMAAKRKLAAKSQEAREEGEDVDPIEALSEALETDEGRQIMEEAVGAAFAAIVAPRLSELVEAALEDERELIQAEADASAQRQLQVRDLKDVAHEMIRESKLPATFQAELLERYDLVGGRPTPSLDVIEDVDDEGEVTKTAEEKLRETVEADIARKREQYAEARPTTVRGQGEAKPAKPAAKAEGEEGEVEEAKTPKSTGSARTDALLQEAGIEADDDLYAGITGQ
jgi:hypothetical protein